MANKPVCLPILCLLFLGIAVLGCSQTPTTELAPTLAPTALPDLAPSPTPPLPTATSAPTSIPTRVQSDQPATEKPHQSGIQGQVLQGPMCGGPVSVDDPCPDQPFSAVFHVLDDQGNRVARFLTDEQGNFHIGLLPGEYTIVPDESALLMSPGAQKREVAVREGEFVRVTLTFDTGMR